MHLRMGNKFLKFELGKGLGDAASSRRFGASLKFRICDPTSSEVTHYVNKWIYRKLGILTLEITVGIY